MESFKILTIKIIGIIKCIKQYTSEPSITNTLDGLENALDANDFEIILYSCNQIADWYNKNISAILSNEFVHNKNVHRENITSIQYICSTLKKKRNRIQEKFIA